MERDKSHKDQIERWAKFVKENPLIWKNELKDFLDSQIIMSENFYQRLGKTEIGKKKIVLIRNERRILTR
jgi:hypothetical protein